MSHSSSNAYVFDQMTPQRDAIDGPLTLPKLDDRLSELTRRLDRIEQKLDQLLARQDSSTPQGSNRVGVH